MLELTWRRPGWRRNITELVQQPIEGRHAILDGTPLIAPAPEGIHSVELANATLFSSARNQTVDLPLDATAYEKHLREKFPASRFKKNAPRKHGAVADDLASSFHR